MRVLPWLYLVAIFAFILLPVVTLVVFSFQDGRLPVPPFKGATLKWYADILADRALMEALGNSLLVAFVSALVALVLYPIVWLLMLPFRLLGVVVDGVLETVWAVITLPARLLGAKPRRRR